MSYEYIIYRPDNSEEVATTFSTDVPIAHILVGHWLTLSTPEFEMQTNHRLRIEGVECHMSQNKFGHLGRTRVEVYVTEEVRTPQ